MILPIRKTIHAWKKSLDRLIMFAVIEIIVKKLVLDYFDNNKLNTEK